MASTHVQNSSGAEMVPLPKVWTPAVSLVWLSSVPPVNTTSKPSGMTSLRAPESMPLPLAQKEAYALPAR